MSRPIESVDPAEPGGQTYDSIYKKFDSPLQRQLRSEAYGKDIGQHSWVTADELQQDIARLEISSASRVLDLGCGPAGPLTFIVAQTGSHGTGADFSGPAVASGEARAKSQGLEARIVLQQADLNDPLPFTTSSFDAVISLDVILHLRDRAQVFREVARVLVPEGKFLFTDAGAIAGPVSNEQIRHRALHGYTQFAPAGFNERVLQQAGFRVLETADRTPSLLKIATGRLTARLAHRQELQQLEGATGFESQQQYLETIIDLAQKRALLRMMYLAKRA